MNPLSRGEFGIRYGLPRILDLLDKCDIKATFYLPGHTAVHHAKEVRGIAERGHDIGSHGMYHQPKEVGLLGSDTSTEDKRRYLKEQIEAIEKATGVHPVGFRSPIEDYGPDMPELLLEEGYLYDSSLQGSDFIPYRLRIGDKYEFEEPYDISFGKPSKIIEIPWMWDLDDFPHFEFMSYYLDHNNGWYGQAPLSSPENVKEVFLGHFDFMYESVPGGVYTTAQHPQCSGRGMRLLGDMHASQGDAEWTGVAVETRGELRVSCDLVKKKSIPYPRVETPRSIIQLNNGRPLERSISQAWIWMMSWLVDEYKFSKIDAYQFISCCPDARINVYQMIPDNWYTVGVEIPKAYLI